MTEDEFWNGLPILAEVYREKHLLEIEQKNQILWLQGLYVFNGFEIALSNAFRKKGAKRIDYMKEPINILPDKKEKENAKEKEKIVDDFRTQLLAISKKMEAKHKKAQGGEKP